MDPTSIICLNRVRQYESAGWMTRSEADLCIRRIHDTDFVSLELQKALKRSVNSKWDPPEIKPALSTVSTNSSVHGRSDAIQNIKEKLKDNHHKKAPATHPRPLTKAPVSTNPIRTDRLIWEPAEFSKTYLIRNKETIVSELFVESCFFARLGFLQPPCCLACAYSETTAACPRWVVWRKNTMLMLHPDTIATNIVVMSCGTAQKLLKHQVDGWVWDEPSHLLYETGDL